MTLALILAACAFPAQQATEVPLTRLLPDTTTAFLSWRTPLRHLERLGTWSPLADFRPEAGWLSLLEQPDLERWVDRLGPDPWALLGDLAGRGIEFGLVPSDVEGQPSMLLTLEHQDAGRGRRALDQVLEATGAHFGFPRMFQRPHGAVAGRDAYYLGDDLTIVVEERRVLIANDRAFLEQAFRDAKAPGHLGLLGVRSFQSCRAMAPSGPDFWAFIDVERGRELQPQLERFASDLYKGIARPQPLAVLGPAFATLADSGAWSAWIEPEDRGFELGLSTANYGEYASVLRPAQTKNAEDRAPAPTPVGRAGDLLDGLIYRDFAAWLEARVDLFDEGAQARLVSQLAELENLFGGVAFDRDLTPQLSPWWRVVSRPLEFGRWPEPDLALPGIALIGRLQEPLRWGPYLEAGFQSLAVLTNVDRAQQGNPPLLLRPGQVDEVPYTAAHFPPPLDPAEIDVNYNAAPAFAVAGDHVVLASHESLLREVVGDLRAARPQRGVQPRGEVLQVHGAVIHEVLDAELDTLAVLHALEEGLEIPEARAQLETLLAAVRGFDVTLTAEYPDDALIVRSHWEWTPARR
ncbi:MAG: hypothetical protein ACYS26_03770 [Planctomycetota bacterium]|jgi:hypothetical protein